MHSNIDLTDLSHRTKHLLATPFGNAPIVVVLVYASYAYGPICTTAAAEETTSGESAFAIVEARLRRRDNIPVCRAGMVLGPAIINVRSAVISRAFRKLYLRAGHVHVVHFLAVLASLDKEYRSIWIL
jgi:hypothetical protein